jgi:SARP family transcriptional regulator, regulator of embCAB operon
VANQGREQQPALAHSRLLPCPSRGRRQLACTEPGPRKYRETCAPVPGGAVSSSSYGGPMTWPEPPPGADHSSEVLVLDGFQLWRSGIEQVGIPRASQRLLALLAIRGGVTNRAAVAGTLWPDATEIQACSNLRSALARLDLSCRKMLQVSKLELGLAKDVTVDICYAQRLARRLLDPAVTLEQSDLSSAAIVILSGDLLPGWYDDWVLVKAEDWRQLRLHALETLAGRLTAVDCWGQAADAARAAVRAEPLRESAHAVLIQVHLAEGNQSEAVRQFIRYRALLHAELGLEPTVRLRRLMQGLQSQSR